MLDDTLGRAGSTGREKHASNVMHSRQRTIERFQSRYVLCSTDPSFGGASIAAIKHYNMIKEPLRRTYAFESFAVLLFNQRYPCSRAGDHVLQE
jgi:hypothetical protein